ncbi:hypothetical protein FB567DRAFT_114118 [Paraphoma chrysanthemicola]|uniref:Uncharacterized protein n=1 Tax=Paraphoma chrysanthemicola TaxID=798071 RepID=A0A8K0VW99_9PLEO|nr:hypothetical protein FB567DRAFT_114118 [Paraphoma chrysanthemicola]
MSRASKKKAILNMSTTRPKTVPSEDGCQTPSLKIRVPKKSWNAYQAPPEPYQSLAARPTDTARLILRLRLPEETLTKMKSSATPNSIDESQTEPNERTSCKVKLWAFHYGGPKRVTKGASQHDVTYETPCLQSTCANCWKWHRHLMPTERPSQDFEHLRRDPVSSIIETVSPDIVPRILDGSWHDHQS